MYVKYNAVMRAKAVPASGDVPAWAVEAFGEMCKGNSYTTTIWVLNSAIVKLKTLTSAEKVALLAACPRLRACPLMGGWIGGGGGSWTH